MRLPARFTISTSPSDLLENRSHIFLSKRSQQQRTYIGTRIGPVFLQARLGILGGDQLQISIASAHDDFYAIICGYVMITNAWWYMYIG